MLVGTLNQSEQAVMEKEERDVRVQTAFEQVLKQALRRGFYGTAGIVVSVQDGHVQHIRMNVERMVK